MTNDKARSDREASAGWSLLQSFKTYPALGSVALVSALLVGCSQKPAERSDAPPVASASANAAASARTIVIETNVFQVRGVVQEVRLSEKEVVIKHEVIPNYMPAMTMPFEVRNTNELTGLAPNDQVTFRMLVTDADGWIEDIKKIGTDVTSQVKQPRQKVRMVRDVEPLAVGDKMTNYPLTNSLGQRFEFKDFAGQAYAITFIFTRCPFPNFCPRMNRNFQFAYEALKNNPQAPTNWHLVSVSFDPEFDTPERLKEYSAIHQPDPKHWSWATGAMIEIDALTEQLGVVFAFENNTINHNLRTAVVDKNGVIRQIFIGNEWTSEDLVRELIAGAEGKEIGKF